ncbi:protein CIA1-like [Beta vulgaris subsp. vulgaris]|uniref:protein CIA1-like n=1 Tax=Beta vulgaris subsp. vulgaris TaxID=3555 RepID=UPI002037306A|nr:protein CIA1-like [Beta vulgaris subsp. vulgaris]
MGELEHLQTLEGHTDRVWGLAWNPINTNLLASCSGDKTVCIWEQSFSGSFNCKAVLEKKHTRTIRSCAWSPSGKMLATASFDATMAIWADIGGDFEYISNWEIADNLLFLSQVVSGARLNEIGKSLCVSLGLLLNL